MPLRSPKMYSFILERRLKNPFVRNDAGGSGLTFAIARDNPLRPGPAGPPTPPPRAVTTTSTWSARLVNFNGSVASCFHAKFGKYCSTVRLLIVNLPEPARKNTRAIDSLRRPVPRNQFVPAMGVPVELNAPPQLQTVPVKPEPANFTLRFTRPGRVAPYSTKEGTATCGKTLARYLRQTWRLEYCRLLTYQNNNPRISVAQPLCCVLKQSLQRDSPRILPRVPRQSRRIAINAQLLRPPRAQLVLRQHPENRLANHPIRLGGAQPLRRNFLQPTRVPAVREINFLLNFVPVPAHLLAIDNYHMLAPIHP